MNAYRTLNSAANGVECYERTPNDVLLDWICCTVVHDVSRRYITAMRAMWLPSLRNKRLVQLTPSLCRIPPASSDDETHHSFLDSLTLWQLL
ncbi:hypothetical protein TNCV_1424431 [Trichonephila clavipes]|nr:hypothetical protein TNCV_1424431 [Trichonephila clavipes]